MKKMKWVMLVVLSTMVGTLWPSTVLAQDAGAPPEGGDQGERREWRDRDRNDDGDRNERRRNFDPEAMRQRYMDRIKESLGMSDDEWTAISPLLTAVTDKQNELRQLSFGGRMGFRRGGEDNTENEMTALRTSLESESTSPEKIKENLDALRAARKEKEEAVDAAQEELKGVLTVRQEAQLVLSGILD